MRAGPVRRGGRPRGRPLPPPCGSPRRPPPPARPRQGGRQETAGEGVARAGGVHSGHARRGHTGEDRAGRRDQRAAAPQGHHGQRKGAAQRRRRRFGARRTGQQPRLVGVGQQDGRARHRAEEAVGAQLPEEARRGGVHADRYAPLPRRRQGRRRGAPARLAEEQVARQVQPPTPSRSAGDQSAGRAAAPPRCPSGTSARPPPPRRPGPPPSPWGPRRPVPAAAAPPPGGAPPRATTPGRHPPARGAARPRSRSAPPSTPRSRPRRPEGRGSGRACPCRARAARRAGPPRR